VSESKYGRGRRKTNDGRKGERLSRCNVHKSGSGIGGGGGVVVEFRIYVYKRKENEK